MKREIFSYAVIAIAFAAFCFISEKIIEWFIMKMI